MIYPWLIVSFVAASRMTGQTVMIRETTVEDVPLLMNLIAEKADFDRNVGAFASELQVTPEVLKTNLFGDHPFAFFVLACDEGEETPEKSVVGFANYHFRFSSFAGRPSLFLEDLFVRPECRSQGTGKVLMNHLAQIAFSKGCNQLNWNSDGRNELGTKFYSRLGAELVRQTEHRCDWKWVPRELDEVKPL